MISFRKTLLLGVSIFCVVLSSSGALASEPISSARGTVNYMLIEFLFGLQGALIGGGAGYYGTYLALSVLQPCPPDSDEQACEFGKALLSLVIGTNVGIPLGAALMGVHLGGLLVRVEGNLFLAWVGAVLGTFAGSALGGTWAVQPTDLTLVINPVTLAAFGATIGYNVGSYIPDQGIAKRASVKWVLPLFYLRF
jgi:hypothetical protein